LPLVLSFNSLAVRPGFFPWRSGFQPGSLPALIPRWDQDRGATRTGGCYPHGAILSPYLHMWKLLLAIALIGSELEILDPFFLFAHLFGDVGTTSTSVERVPTMRKTDAVERIPTVCDIPAVGRSVRLGRFFDANRHRLGGADQDFLAQMRF
jgi:hypothetical protein